MTSQTYPRPTPDYNRARYQRSKALWRHVLIRIDHDDHDALRKLAKFSNISVAEMVRIIIMEHLEECR